MAEKGLGTFTYTVKVKAASRAEAERVMGERIMFDADYGFPYELWVAGTVNGPYRDNPKEGTDD